MVIIRYLRVGIMILTVYDHNTTILILWGVLSYQLSTQGPLEIRIRSYAEITSFLGKRSNLNARDLALGQNVDHGRSTIVHNPPNSIPSDVLLCMAELREVLYRDLV